MTKLGTSRRKFITKGALGVGATAVVGIAAQDGATAQRVTKWDRSADVVIAGAGASGLCAAIMARDQGASVIIVEQNHDIGGHAMVSGGRIPLGGGTRLQKKFGVVDSADQVYLDHTNFSSFGTAIATWCGCGPMKTRRPLISSSTTASSSKR
jgi:monoamine oxidase